MPLKEMQNTLSMEWSVRIRSLRSAEALVEHFLTTETNKNWFEK